MSANAYYEKLVRIDAVVTEFEKKWTLGKRPNIEDYLLQAVPDDREALLLELIETEVELLSSAGKQVDLSIYARRFPEYSTVLDKKLKRNSTVATRVSIARAVADKQMTLVGSHLDTTPGDASKRIANFELIEKIGEGGMGVVFKAKQSNPSRVVAVKMMRATKRDARLLERFKQEAEAVARLDHANIVPVFEFGEEDGLHYLSMPYLKGESLGAKVRERTLNSKHAAQLMVQITDAIAHAHERGVVHRDLKPGNVLVTEDGVPRVLDFGLAANEDREYELTRSGEVIGTPAFMSPEQASGKHRDVGASSDIYSLGAILYYLLTGVPPHNAPTSLETLSSIINKDVLAPSEHNGSVSRDLETICLKCLEKEPARRYPSATELRNDLQAFFDGEPIKARPIGFIERGFRWCKRKPWPAAAAGLLVALGFSSVGAAAFYQQASRSERLRADSEKELRIAAELSALEAGAYRTRAEILHLKQTANSGDLHSLENLRANYSSLDLVPLLAEQSLPKPALRVSTFRGPGMFEFVAASLNTDGNLLATADAGGVITVHRFPSGEVISQVTQGRLMNFDSLDDSGQLQAVEGWHAHAGSEAPENVKQLSFYASLCWLDNPEQLCATRDDGSCMLFDPMLDFSEPGAEPTTFLQTEKPMTTSCSVDGKRVLFGDGAGNVVLVERSAEDSRDKGIGKVVARRAISESTITSIAHGEEFWIVADVRGRLYFLDSMTLATQHELQLSSACWDLSLCGSNELLAAAESAQLFRIDLSSFPPTVADVLISPTNTEHGYSACEWIANKNEVWAVDHAGYVHVWNASSNRGTRVCQGFKRTRTRGKWESTEASTFHRSAVGLFASDRVVSIAAADGNVSGWNFETRDNESLFTPQQVRVGASPDIEFTAGRRICALDQTGKLTLLEVGAENVFSDVQAHEIAAGLDPEKDTGPCYELRCMQDGRIATVAEGKRIKLWRLKNKRLEVVQELISEKPLMSLDISEAAQLAGAVDTDGRLNLWDLENGRRILVEAIAPGVIGRPLTGKLAFSRSGKYVLAFGFDQSSLVLDTQTKSRIKATPVAGEGGVAASWSKLHEEFWLRADSRPIAATQALNTAVVQSIEIAAADVKNAGQYLLLTENGKLTAWSDPHGVQLFDMEHQIEEACALASDGTRIAIASHDGSIHVLRIGDEQLAKEPASQPIVTKMSEIDLPPGRRSMKQLPKFGDGASICTISYPNRDHYEGGQLVISTRNNEGKWKSELIDDRQVFAHSKLYTRGGKELIAFRQLNPDAGVYSGELMLCSRKSGQANWEFEQVSPTSNMGHYPQLVFDENDQVIHIAHFDHWLNGVVLSTKGDVDEDGWPYKRIVNLFGVHLNGISDANSTFLNGNSIRHNGDIFTSVAITIRNGNVSQVSGPSFGTLQRPMVYHGEIAYPVRSFDGKSCRTVSNSTGSWKDVAPSLAIDVQQCCFASSGERMVAAEVRNADSKLRIASLVNNEWQWYQTEFPYKGRVADVKVLPSGQVLIAVWPTDLTNHWLRVVEVELPR